MQNFINFLAVIQKFIKIITWVKIAQLTAMLSIIAIVYALFDNRMSIIKYGAQHRITNSPAITKLSKNTINELDSFVAKSNSVIGVHIALIDFQKNLKHIVYSKSTNIALDVLTNKYLDSISSDLPLFDDNTVNNKHIIDIINGEFICYPVEDSNIIKLNSAITQYVKTVCAVGIPPYYGKFDGIIWVYINKPLSPTDYSQLQYTLKTISLHIYDHDSR